MPCTDTRTRGQSENKMPPVANRQERRKNPHLHVHNSLIKTQTVE